jgi:stage II sporulation protein D
LRALLVALAVLLTAGYAAASPRVFVIVGRGEGHGVGLGQWGAEGFAVHGWSYRSIVAHYYPGTTIGGTPDVPVRVLLAEGANRVTISSKAPFRVIDGRGRSRTLRRAVRIPGRFRPPLRFEPGAAPLAFDGRGYRGQLHVEPGLNVVNVVPVERYLRGVVPAEMPFFWRSAALEAQAVAARSYALAERKPWQSFDLYADQRDQVYDGIRVERPSTNLAVGATAGQVLVWDGRPAVAYYSASTGGRTAAATDALPQAPDVPYLVPVTDPYDSLSPDHRWGPFAFVAQTLAQRLDVPGVRGLAVARNGSGRVSAVEVVWRGGHRTVSGGEFASKLGLPSTWFRVRGSGRLPSSPLRAAVSVPDLAGDWPAGRSGYTVVLDSIPESSGEKAARAEATNAARSGLPSVGVLRSSDFSSLRPGYWVVFTGVYGSAGQAAAAARTASGRYPAAYARQVTP